MDRVLLPWFSMWQAVTFRNGLSDGQYEKIISQAVRQSSTRSLFGLISWNGSSEEAIGAIVSAAKKAGDFVRYTGEVSRDEYMRREAEYAKGYKRGDGAGASKTVNISSITITVSSDSADAATVAREVREELFRQINAAIDDAQTGVNAI